MNDRKPRASEIRVDFGKEQVLSGMQVSEDGALTFFDETGESVDPLQIEVGKTYPRPAKKTPKVLTRAPADRSSIQLDPNRLLLKYTYLFAADTNTAEINGTRVSISVPARISDIVIEQPRWSAKLVPLDAFEFHDAADAPERIGWSEFLRGLASHPEVHGMVGLIVDSELDALRAINVREQPGCCIRKP